MARMSVLLPAPDGPERSADSPRASERLTPEMSAAPPGRGEVDVVDRQCRPVAVGPPDAVERGGLARTRPSASSKPTSRWTTDRHSAMSVYDDTMNERVLYLAERRGGLHEPAELNLAAEEPRRRHHEGEDDRRLAVARREPRQPLLLAHDVPPVADHRAEAGPEIPHLVGLAVVQGHALGVLAEAHEAEAEIRLVALPVEVHAHERPADAVGEPGADDRVEERGPNHVARDGDEKAADGQGHRAGEAPQDGDEGDQRDHGAHAPDPEPQRAGHEKPQVFCDALVRVVGLAAGELHAIVRRVLEPFPEVPLGQPAPPADLQHLVQVELVHGHDDEAARQPREAEELLETWKFTILVLIIIANAILEYGR